MKKTPLKRKTGLGAGLKPLSTSNGLERNKSLVKQSKKYIAGREERIEEGRKMIEFFNEIWAERDHLCFCCESFLGNEPNTMFFEHGLEKSTYPQYRYNKENLTLVCPPCHACKSAGFPIGPYKEKLKELKLKHENGTL